MKKNNEIEKLFSEHFEHFEAPVKPELWTAVSQGISSSSGAVAVSSIGVFGKALIAAAVLIIPVAAVLYVVLNNSDEATAQIHHEITVDDTQDLEPKLEVQEPIALPIENQKSEEKEANEITPIASENIENESAIVLSQTRSHESDAVVTTAKREAKETKDQVKKTDLLQQAESNESEKRQQEPEAKISKEQEKTLEKEERAEPSYVGVDKIDVTVENYNKQINEIKLPNVFTPNNDGLNDYLEIKLEGVSYFRIEVYSAKGELVFFSEDSSFKWDGYHLNGSPVPNGRYVYQVETRDMQGNAQKPKVQTLEIKR